MITIISFETFFFFLLLHGKVFDALALALLEFSSEVTLAAAVPSGIGLAQPRSLAFLFHGPLVHSGVLSGVGIVLVVFHHYVALAFTCTGRCRVFFLPNTIKKDCFE